jgi:hypothetical protein
MYQVQTSRQAFLSGILIASFFFLIFSLIPNIGNAQTSGTSGTEGTRGTDLPTSQPAPSPQGTFTLTNPLKVNSVGDLVKNFVDIFSTVVIILAVLTLIWVGLQFILARGDVAKMKELKEWLLWIVVGIAVVISARLIVDIVINTLSATGTIDANTLNTIKSAK